MTAPAIEAIGAEVLVAPQQLPPYAEFYCPDEETFRNSPFVTGFIRPAGSVAAGGFGVERPVSTDSTVVREPIFPHPVRSDDECDIQF